jgi:hypothetical protein
VTAEDEFKPFKDRIARVEAAFKRNFATILNEQQNPISEFE